jgi:predicted DNA-binding transcriptional regulator YafY
MPTNLHQLLRYQVINERLRRGRRQSWRELSEACGEALRESIGPHLPDPSRRTICGDIARMRAGITGLPAPIKYDQARHAYYYSDSSFSIDRAPLSVEDARLMTQTLHLLRYYRELPVAGGMEDFLARLRQALPEERVGTPIIQLDANREAAGLCWLGDLYQAIERKQPLLVRYQPFGEDTRRQRFSPYLLKEYNNRWFLIGWEHDERAIYTLALDRIVELEEDIMGDYYRDPCFDADERYRHLIGVTLPENAQPETVRLRVDAAQAPYLVTKPPHHTQREEYSDETHTIFSYLLIPNYELQSQILALGEKVEVLAPEHLRARIAERARRLAGLYALDEGMEAGRPEPEGRK